MMWGFDAGCLFKAAPPIDPFSGGEISTYDAPSSVHHILYAPSLPGRSKFREQELLFTEITISREKTNTTRASGI